MGSVAQFLKWHVQQTNHRPDQNDPNILLVVYFSYGRFCFKMLVNQSNFQPTDETEHMP